MRIKAYIDKWGDLSVEDSDLHLVKHIHKSSLRGYDEYDIIDQGIAKYFCLCHDLKDTGYKRE